MYQVTKKTKYMFVQAPYNEEFVNQAKEDKGVWDKNQKAWKFPKEYEKKISETLERIYSQFVEIKAPYSEEFVNIAKTNNGVFYKENTSWIFPKNIIEELDIALNNRFGWNFRSETVEKVIIYVTDDLKIINNKLELAGYLVATVLDGKIKYGKDIKITSYKDFKKIDNGHYMGKGLTFEIPNFPATYKLPAGLDYYENILKQREVGKKREEEEMRKIKDELSSFWGNR